MRACPACGQELVRRTFPSGRRETPSGFSKRTFCSIQCAQKVREKERCSGARLTHIKAHRVMKDRCEACGVEAAEKRLVVHHKDEDQFNNNPSNLMTLCDSCHRHAHSHRFMADLKTVKPCLYCSRPSKAKSVCTMHLERWRKYGHPLARKRKTAFGNEWVLMLHDGNSWFPFPSPAESRLGSGACAATEILCVPRSPKPSSKR